MTEAAEVRAAATQCIVIYPDAAGRGGGSRGAAAELAEAKGLACAIDLEIAHAEIINVQRPRPATFLGRGAVERLRDVIKSLGREAAGGLVVYMNCALTPVQQRNLETGLNCKVIDRTGLILEIFGARARTKEGRLQVDLAALTYQRSRLVRSWTHLERQRGGAGFTGGPGERQIELDRRLIDQRIDRIKRQLKDVRRTRGLHRKARRKVPYPVVALVGYTNAGKSTLFNRLTGSRVMAKDQLFATLDPTMRAVDLPDGRQAVLSDTVGFVSSLPHELVNAFHATLEEVSEADIIVHVRDISHPDADSQKRDVEKVLEDLGIGDAPQGKQGKMIEALNKIDLLAPAERSDVENRIVRGNDQAVAVSALTGDGCPAFLDLVSARLSDGFEILDVRVDPGDGRRLAWLYRHGEVIAREDADAQINVTVRLSPAEAARFQRV